jgi:hypothetical protein
VAEINNNTLNDGGLSFQKLSEADGYAARYTSYTPQQAPTFILFNVLCTLFSFFPLVSYFGMVSDVLKISEHADVLVNDVEGTS